MNAKVLLKGKGDDILLPITRGELVLDENGNEAFRSGLFLATKESNGLMSLEDKKKLVTYELEGTPSTAGYAITLSNDGDIDKTTSVVPTFKGATDSESGELGLVPAPKVDNKDSFLKGDGTWGTPVDTWIANSANNDGYVTKGFGKYNKVWKTNEYGVPTWRDDLDFNVSQNNVSENKDYRVLLSHNANDDNVVNITNKSSKLTFNPYNGILTSTRFAGYINGIYVDKLTDYSKGSSLDSIETTDSLNDALGKLEYKSDLGWEAYQWYKSVTDENDSDVYINKWYEIVDFLNGVDDTTNILDEFVTRKKPLTIIGSKTFNPESEDALTLSRTNYSTVGINFKWNTTNLGWIGFAGENNIIFKDISNNLRNLLHSGNSSVSKSGETLTVKINGVTKSLTNSTYTKLPNPYSIKFINASGTTVTYDGSNEQDLTDGINYATDSSNLKYHSSLIGDTAIDSFFTSGILKIANFSSSTKIGANDGILMSLPRSSNYGIQLAFDDVHDVNMFIRGKASTWGDWFTVMHSNNFSRWINEANFPGLNKVGTVTSVAVGAGLRLSDNLTSIKESGTISCNLSSTASLGTLGTTNGLCAVGVDSDGKLCVSVPTSSVSVMTGATTISDGTSGLVPKPVKGDNTKFLCGDGKWKELSTTNTTYTFEDGTNCFYVTPSGGSKQTVNVTPSITNNITGSGTNNCIAKFNGTNTITNGPAFGSATTTYLRNDGSWATPPDTKITAGASNAIDTKLFLVGARVQATFMQTYTNSNVFITTDNTLSVQDTILGSELTDDISAYYKCPVLESHHSSGNSSSIGSSYVYRSDIADYTGKIFMFGNNTSSTTITPIRINNTSFYYPITIPAGKRLELSVVVSNSGLRYNRSDDGTLVYSASLTNGTNICRIFLSNSTADIISTTTSVLASGVGSLPNTLQGTGAQIISLKYTNTGDADKTVYVHSGIHLNGAEISNIKNTSSSEYATSGTYYLGFKAQVTSVQFYTPYQSESYPSGSVAKYGKNGYVIVDSNTGRVDVSLPSVYFSKRNNKCIRLTSSKYEYSDDKGLSWESIPN